MGNVGRDPRKSFSPTSLIKQGSLHHFTQHFLELTAAVSLFWLLSGYHCCSRQIQRKNWIQVSIFFNFKENGILYDSINEAYMLQIPFIFSHLLMFSLCYAITSRLLSTTVDKHSLPRIWGVSWLCLNVAPCIEFYLIFSWSNFISLLQCAVSNRNTDISDIFLPRT